MSLESKIEDLIKALNANTEALTASKASPVVEQKKPVAKKSAPSKTETKSEPEQAPATDTEEQVSHKDVQDAVLAFVRKDTTKNKPLVRTLLDGFNAQKVSDLDESRLGIFLKQLKAL